ncbi:MAG: hypothetical protein QOJ54_3239 [Aliidongia sp.]|jgi:hypothetical protein|nr:hypothetical protein [Aliidongia sp.]
MPGPSTIFLSGAIRRLAVAALKNAVAAGVIIGPGPVTIDSPGDWNTPSEAMPVILVRTGLQKKTAKAMQLTEFESLIALEIQVQLQDKSAKLAQDWIEMMGAGVEQALYSDLALLGSGSAGLIERIAAVEAETRINSNGKLHIAELDFRIWCQTLEIFGPPPGVPLVQIEGAVNDTAGNQIAAFDVTDP